MSHPSIDHTLLSPSGKASKRARAAALKREHDRLFPTGYWDDPAKSAEQLISEQRAKDLNWARELRALADRGMSPTKHRKAAQALEDKWSPVIP